jgi:threonine/homoserine/homoserine lactone efflux protein
MLSALVGFALASTLLILAPGPDSLLVVRNTMRGGRRLGVCTAAGILSGLLAWALAVALGLAALLQASRVGYDVLRLAGAAYLIWLGLCSLGLYRRERGHGKAHENPRPQAAQTDPPAPSAGRAYVNGLVSNICNPKIGVFFIAFLPGFIPHGESSAAFSFALGAWFVIETGAWLAAVVWMVTRGVGWLSRRSAQRWLERATGVVMIGFGVRLAAQAR